MRTFLSQPLCSTSPPHVVREYARCRATAEGRNEEDAATIAKAAELAHRYLQSIPPQAVMMPRDELQKQTVAYVKEEMRKEMTFGQKVFVVILCVLFPPVLIVIGVCWVLDIHS